MIGKEEPLPVEMVEGICSYLVRYHRLQPWPRRTWCLSILWWLMKVKRLTQVLNLILAVAVRNTQKLFFVHMTFMHDFVAAGGYSWGPNEMNDGQQWASNVAEIAARHHHSSNGNPARYQGKVDRVPFPMGFLDK